MYPKRFEQAQLVASHPRIINACCFSISMVTVFLWSAQTLVILTLGNSHLLIGQFDSLSYHTSIEPVNLIHGIFHTRIVATFCLKSVCSPTITEAELCYQ